MQYLCNNIVENGSEITIDKISYSENFKLINCMNRKTDTKDLLQSQLRKLLWICSKTRPDIKFDVCQLGTNFQNSLEEEIKYVNKVATHLKQDPV